MRGLAVATAIVAATMGVGAVRADEAEANRLLVEAIGLAEQAARAPREEAVELYRQAGANLDAIVAEHPDSPYAVLIATGQPIGSFRPWEVRHELARLSAAPAPACAAPCVWERQYGDGRGNLLQAGGTAWMMADLLPRPDGTAVVVGTYWHDREKEVWLTALGPDGVRLWERTYTGVACGAALIDGGFVVLADKVIGGEDMGVLMLLDDGLAPTGVPVPFDPYAVEPDGDGGFLVMGGDGAPVVRRYDASGSQLWSWSEPGALVPGAESGAVTAAIPLGDTGDVRVLGFWDGAVVDGEAVRVIWTGVLAADGTMRDVTEVDEVPPGGLGRPCEPVMRWWSIGAAGDGFVVRYDWQEPSPGLRRTTVARLDAAGAVKWWRVEPIDVQAQDDPQAAMEAGVDEITAVSSTADGGVLVAGLRRRPLGQGAGYISRWDAGGNTMWSTELRRPMGQGEGMVRDAFFAAVEEAPGGGVLAAMTDGVLTMRLRAFVFRLGPNGEAP